MTKHFSGQDIFILCMGFIALLFIYTVLMITDEDAFINGKHEYTESMEGSFHSEHTLKEQYAFNLKE